MTYEKIYTDNQIEIEKLEGSLSSKKQNAESLKTRSQRLSDRIENQFREREIIEKNFEQIQRDIEEYEETLKSNDTNIKRLEMSLREVLKVSARKQLENDVYGLKISSMNAKLNI